MSNVYDGNSVKELIGLEKIRNKPTVYVGHLKYAISHLIRENVDNIVDEYLAKAATKGVIKINTKTKTIEVSDDGRGIPIWSDPVKKDVDALTKCVFIMHAGAKLDNDGTGGYRTSIGTHGIGLSCCAALSTDFEVGVVRDNHKAIMKSFKGIINEDETKVIPYNKPTNIGGKTGTTLRYTIDTSILVSNDFNEHRFDIETSLEIFAATNPGLKLILEWDNEKPQVYYDTRGLKGLALDQISKDKIKLITKNMIHIKKDIPYGGYEIIIGFANTNKISSFVNTLKTVEDGVHVDVVLKNISILIRQFIKSRNLMTKGDVKNFGSVSNQQIISCLTGVISTTLSGTPEYLSQTKARLTQNDYELNMGPSIKQDLEFWFNKNVDDVTTFAKHVIKVARAGFAAKNASENVMKAKSTNKKSTIHDTDVKKFTDCESNDANICELFITEGNSAGDNVAVVRNSYTQAVFRMKGKGQNAIQSSKLSDEWIKLVDAMGCGFGAKFDINKLRFRKIIILTDADVDGDHIKSLLYAFFMVHYKSIVEAGYLYFAKPPLYIIEHGKHTTYIHNNTQLMRSNRMLALQLFDLLSHDNEPVGYDKDTSTKIFIEYMKRIEGYELLMMQLASPLNIPEELLELICVHFETLKRYDKHNYKIFEKYNYSISKHELAGDHSILLEFNKGFNVYPLVIDKNFFTHTYKTVMDALIKIQIVDVHLYSKQNKEHYSDITYNIAKTINSLLLGAKGVDITRCKGLGEMEPDELLYTSLDPETREVTQLVLEDHDVMDDHLDILFGKKRMDEKRIILDGEGTV